MKSVSIALGLALLASAAESQQQQATPRTDQTSDPSPHRLRFVSVDGVRVPYLDWGGTGTAMVFIPGFGNSAHAYDEFAPRFTDRFRVLGVTRVGYGESDQPVGKGYDIQSRVAHIAAAMDSARVQRAILIGHSLGGDEITAFAVAHPERTVGLVYLDAAIDHARIWGLDEKFGALFADMPAPSPTDFASPQALQARMKKFRGMTLPISEMVAIWTFDAKGKPVIDKASDRVASAIRKATVSPEFSRVRAPVLALYSDMTVDNSLPWAKGNPAALAKIESTLPGLKAEISKLRADFRKAVPSAQVFEYPAHHYQFRTMPEDTERRIRAFVGTIKP